DRLATERRLPVTRRQAVEPAARRLGAGPPQAPASAHEVMHIVQWDLNAPEALEVKESPGPLMPQDVGRPEVTALQQARQGDGPTDRRVQGPQLSRAHARPRPRRQPG